MNGWTVKDTSSSGTPTYLCASDVGMVLSIVNTNEAQILTMYTNDVLPYDLRYVQNVWWVASVSGIDSTTTLVMGLASAQNDTSDTVSVNAWFRMEGSASTTALVVETDDNDTNLDDKATGTTLAGTLKRMFVDFSQGLADARFYVDGARVAATTTFDMSGLAAGGDVQPYVQIQKSGGTGTPAVTLRQFGISYKWSYGA